jgi:hypothetical protein
MLLFRFQTLSGVFDTPFTKGSLFWDMDSARPLKALLLGSIDGG